MSRINKNRHTPLTDLVANKASEQILSRKQRFKIYSLLDKIIENAQIAKRECLENIPNRNKIEALAYKELKYIVKELGETIVRDNTLELHLRS